MVPYLLLLLLSLLFAMAHTSANSCMGSVFCIQKGTRLVQSNSLDVLNCHRFECIRHCARNICCDLVNYNRQTKTCEIIGNSKHQGAIVADEEYDLITSGTEVSELYFSHFEKITSNSGNKFAIYEGYDIIRHDDAIVPNVSLQRCRELCVENTNFLCRSLNYLNLPNKTPTCYLSKSTKDEVGASYVYYGDGKSYEERLCLT